MIYYHIETERLILRPMRVSDAKDMLEYSFDDRVGPQAGWEPMYSFDEVEDYLRQNIYLNERSGSYFYAVVLKEENKMIGTIELYNLYSPNKGELGYSFNPNYWHQGYAHETVWGMIDFGFRKLNLKRIYARMFLDNSASEALCKSCGMKFEGILRNDFLRYDGKIFDSKLYSITDSDYKIIIGEDDE